MLDRQLPLGELKEEAWDVLVAGAGPAGCTAAIRLASKGRRVLLADRRAFPREKICGDGLINDAVRCLERSGVLEEVKAEARELSMATVFSPSRIELEVPGRYLTLEREKLDALLARHAADRGATFLHGRIRDVRALPDGAIEATAGENGGEGKRIRARAAVLATGADVGLLRGLDMVARSEPSAVAIRRYVRSSSTLDRLIGAYDRSIAPGYGWIFPLKDGVFNVGTIMFYKDGRPLGGNIRKVFETFVSEFPLAREVMDGAEPLTPLRGAMMRCSLKGSRPARVGPVIAVGEAIGSTFPFTGEGIGKAMETGERAAEAVDAFLAGDAEALRAFPDRLEKELRPKYMGYEIAERWLSKCWLNDFMARRVRKSPYLQDAVVRVITEEADPRAVFSVWGILRSLWG